MPPIRDVEHAYRDQKGAAGGRRVRVFAATAASDVLPVVILSELDSNHGPSIINTIEQLAAEIATKYLSELDGLDYLHGGRSFGPICGWLVEHEVDFGQLRGAGGPRPRLGPPDGSGLGSADGAGRAAGP